MKKFRVLNLYSGLGGNRRLWQNVDVVAVENNKEIAAIYQKMYPEDIVIVGDAHEYLLNYFNDFDFIWSSPPCQSHSSFRQNICVRFRGTKAVYPDLKLYEEIVFLKYNAKCKWVVENVNPYYMPLIPAKKIQRHLFWSNFEIPDFEIDNENLRSIGIQQLQKLHCIDLTAIKISNKRQILRNCVDSRLANQIFQSALL